MEPEAAASYALNLGGFGLSDASIAIQSSEGLLSLQAVVELILLSQVAFVLKKKQFERLSL